MWVGQEVATVLREFDNNGDGRISYQELAQAIAHKHTQNEVSLSCFNSEKEDAQKEEG